MSLQYPVPGPGGHALRGDIVAVAREQVLGCGDRLTQAQILEVLQLRGDRLGELDRWTARCAEHGATTVSTWGGG